MSSKVRFPDLTDEERAAVCNGCGPKGAFATVTIWLVVIEWTISLRIKPPGWLFKASCDWHDFNYWLGGTELDRARADLQFYLAMRDDAKGTAWWYPTWLATFRAWVYYKAVSIGGRSSFHYGATRTRADLDREVERQRLAA